jgi:hypothetical protein
MTTTYQSIIDKAEILLQDEEADQALRRWPESELLTWLKDGEQQVIKDKPDANPIVEVVQLTAGSQQALPASAVQLLDVLCNMGTDGITRGNIVTVVERKLMNALDPTWMGSTASATVSHVIYDHKRARNMFWVYPQSTGTNYLEVMSGKLPDNASAVITDNTILDDEFAVPLMHYMIAMAYAKDADIPQSAQLLSAHMGIFRQSLGKRDMLENAINPKRTREID